MELPESFTILHPFASGTKLKRSQTSITQNKNRFLMMAYICEKVKIVIVIVNLTPKHKVKMELPESFTIIHPIAPGTTIKG